MREYADLHVHTCLSDGSDTVGEVVALAGSNEAVYHKYEIPSGRGGWKPGRPRL